MSPEREVAAVAYALLIMRDAYALLIMRDGPDFPVDWSEHNRKLVAQFGEKGFIAVKKRAWHHVRENQKPASESGDGK